MEHIISSQIDEIVSVERQDRKTSGQGLVEYALIVLLISIVVIIVLGAVGGQINQLFEDILNGFN